MQIQDEQVKQSLQQCRKYFALKQFDKLNALFVPLLAQEIPEALLTKVDFLMQTDANKGIGYLLHLAQKNTPMANYKMAMLLYFHPELTLDFNQFLLQSYKLQEAPAIMTCVYLAFAQQKVDLAQALLSTHADLAGFEQLLYALNLSRATISKPILDEHAFGRVEADQHSLHYLDKQISLAIADNFLNAFECAWLKLRASKFLEPSMVVNAEDGKKIRSSVRTNEFSQLIPNANDWILLDIEQRISKLIKLPITHGEMSNVLYYQQGHEYKPHYDFFHPNDPGSAVALQDGGQRVRTVLCYLSPAQAGGETCFPRIDQKLAGQQGQLIVFDNVSQQLQPLPPSLHQSLPVISGEKWLLSKWYRQHQTSYKNSLLALNL